MTLGQGQKLTMTLNPHKPSSTQLVSCIYHLSGQSKLISEKSTVFTFTYRKAYVTKFDLAVKKVKVNPASSFEQTMMGWSPGCYMPSFVVLVIGISNPEKIFEGFLPLWAWWPSWSCDTDAANKRSFPLPKEALPKIWL